MKTHKFLVPILIAALGVSCNNNDDEPTYTPSEADAAKIITESLAESSGGIAEEIKTTGAALDAKSGELNLECGVPLDTTFTYILSGSASGLWTRNWNMLLTCPEGELPFLDVQTVYSGSFDGTFRSRNREGSRNWVWSDIGSVGELRTMNGTGNHSGERAFNNNSDYNFSWVYAAEWNEIDVLKETNQVSSGDGTFSLVFTDASGNTTSFEGTVLFNGDQTATVTVNGEVYEVELG